MSTLPIGNRSALLYPNATSAVDIRPDQVVAATPLGRDENGKNLVAYIVRTDDEAPSYKPPGNLANNNTRKSLSDAQQETLTKAARQQRSDSETSAQYIKPDDLLNRLEQSQVDQLRARDQAIRKDTTPLQDHNGTAFITSLVYSTGPDGRRYAVGVSAPLLAKEADEGTSSQEHESAGPANKALSAYKQSAYYNSNEFRSGLFNKEI